jgi:hypothetical protein
MKKQKSYFAAGILMLLLVLGMISLHGCAANSNDNDNNDSGGDNGNGDGGDNGGGTDAAQFSAETDEDGSAVADFRLPAGTTKFGLTASAEGRQVRFQSLTDDDGSNLVSPGGVMISFAGEFLSDINFISVPSRQGDVGAHPEQTYHVTAEVQSSSGIAASGVPVNFTVSAENDGDFTSGSLQVNLFYVGTVGQSSSSKQAVTAALDEFRRIYSSQAHISLRISEFDIDGPAMIPLPLQGSSFYKAAAEQGVSPGVNIFIGGDVQEGVLGLASSIPVPPIPSNRSALAVSILTGAGADGVYDDQDIRLLGETMAHETGHYLGLFHPVDFSGNIVVAEDPLSDTPSCSSKTNCLQNSQLISNLMFTEPVSDGAGGLVPQGQLTNQQQAVLNRYIAVD